MRKFYEVRLSSKLKAGSPTLIEGNQPAISRPPFLKTATPNERADKEASAPEGGLSAGAGIRESCSYWAHIMSHQVGALRALSEEILRGPTLIKVKIWKSDFNRRDPAGNFSAAFLRPQQSQREGGPGRTPSKMRAIRRCRNQGNFLLLGRINSNTSWALGPSARKFYEVRLLSILKA